MQQRVIIAAVGVGGVLAAGLGIGSATLWRASDTLVATVTADAPLVMTQPGVLELGGEPVTVRVTVPDDDPVVLAVGRDTDVLGWIGEDAHDEISGLSDWHTLALADEVPATSSPTTSEAATSPTAGADPSATAATTPADAATPSEGSSQTAAPSGDEANKVPVADPTGSDLWVEQETGDGSATLVWTPREGRWVLLAASPSGSAPTLELSWPRVVTTPWLVPGVVTGGVLVLVALLLAWRDWRGATRRRAQEEWTAVVTGATPVIDAATGRPVALTRRQLREMQSLGVPTGQIPAVPAPDRGSPPSTGVPTSGEPSIAGPTSGWPTSEAVSTPEHETSPAPDTEVPHRGLPTELSASSQPATGRTAEATEAAHETVDPDPGSSAPAPAAPTRGRLAGLWRRSAPAPGSPPVASPHNEDGGDLTSAATSGPSQTRHADPRESAERPGVGVAPQPDERTTASRADAWRRAWGMPGAERSPDAPTSPPAPAAWFPRRDDEQRPSVRAADDAPRPLAGPVGEEQRPFGTRPDDDQQPAVRPVDDEQKRLPEAADGEGVDQ